MNERNQSLDIFKGLLVFGMIYDHVLLFFNDNILYIKLYIILFINLITFSGFMFGFGYSYQIAYFSKDFKDVYKKIISSGIKPLIGFYISAIMALIFVVSDKSITTKDVVNVLILENIPIFSEFLVAFFVVTIFTLIFFNIFKKLTTHKTLFILILVISLLTTFIPYEKVTVTQIGLVIGTTKFYVFPVLQYMPFFLVGMYFSKYHIGFKLKLFMVSVASTSIYLIYYLKVGVLPSRFPPSIYFILGAMFFLYMYYLFSNVIVKKIPTGIIQLMGKNVLFYLIMSNIFLFVFYRRIHYMNLTVLEGLGVTVLVVYIISYLIFIISKDLDGKNYF